ncbi:DNA-binding protein, partial [Bacteroides humanifaecis]
KTSYDTLPERIDYLIQEISEIKNILVNRIEKREETPKYLSTENALAYLKKTGFPMSKSQLYKLTSCGRMPFHKSGNTLLFIPEELDKWCEDKIQTVSHEENELQLLIKSPLNKWKKKV